MKHLLFWGSILLLTSAMAQNKPDKRLIDSINGPALYQSYCASCHGVNATGKGPASDLTRIAARNGGTFPVPRVSRIISGEEQFVPTGHGSRDMPVWGPIFSQVDADQDLGRYGSITSPAICAIFRSPDASAALNHAAVSGASTFPEPPFFADGDMHELMHDPANYLQYPGSVSPRRCGRQSAQNGAAVYEARRNLR